MGFTCCVPECHSGEKIMRVFPIEYEHIYDIWIHRIGNLTIKNCDPQIARKRYRICNKHFSHYCKIPGEKRLKFGSLPTIDLPACSVPVLGFHEPSTPENSLYQYEPLTISISCNTDPTGQRNMDLPETHTEIQSDELKERLVDIVKNEEEITLQENRTVSESIRNMPTNSFTQIIKVEETREQRPEQCEQILPLIEAKPLDISSHSAVLAVSSDEKLPKVEPEAGSSQVISKRGSSGYPRKGGILAAINATKTTDLSSNTKSLYEKACYYQRRAAHSNKTKLTLKQRLRQAKEYTESEAFKTALENMDKIREGFFKCQLENCKRKARGRRYTLEDKLLGLALFLQSGTKYKFLSKLFTLPSSRTCIRLLQRIPVQPGLSESAFKVLEGQVKNFKNPLDKYSLLIFDEMGLIPNRTMNKFEGNVHGHEDFGYKRSNKIANHVMVVMLRGINRKWKQPVYYSFVNGATSDIDIASIIKLIISKCTSVGLQIVGTVCDQSKNNEEAINKLVNETREKYNLSGKQWEDHVFEVDGKLVVPLFDASHLMKGVRNNLLKANLLFKMGGVEMVAKWQHILSAYEFDSHLGSLRAMPKLTEQHVYPDKIKKKKVSYCTEVFSRSVAVGINIIAVSGMSITDRSGIKVSLEKDAQHTAKCLEFMDQLFDSINGSSLSDEKVLRRAVTEESSHMAFWDDAVAVLSTMEFLTVDGAKFVPPSIENFIKTIKNFKILYNYLKKVGFTHMMPRTFNQEPVENFFSKIRQRGRRNKNPTCSVFTKFYKSLLINNLISSHSTGENCVEDDVNYLLTLQRFVTQNLPEDDPDDEFIEVPSETMSGTDQPMG